VSAMHTRRLEVWTVDQRFEAACCWPTRVLPCSALCGRVEVSGPWPDPLWTFPGPGPLFQLNLKPFGRSATLKESEVLVNRRSDLRKTYLP
jgi:hypothetical protein